MAGRLPPAGSLRRSSSFHTPALKSSGDIFDQHPVLHRNLLDLMLYEGLDIFQIEHEFFTGKTDGMAGLSGPGGAADTVDVRGRIVGEVIIYYMGYILYMQSPGSHIGGHQDR